MEAPLYPSGLQKKTKSIGIVLGALLLLSALAYAFWSPLIAFRGMARSIASGDIDRFANDVNSESISMHLRNRMLLQMEGALRSRAVGLDPVGVESRLAPYFRDRAAALATPISVFRELGAQLGVRRERAETEFVDASTVHVRWVSAGDPHTVTLTRRGLSWRVSAIEFPDLMPRFWDQPTEVVGTYSASSFLNCCSYGRATQTPYVKLLLKTPIDVVDVFGSADGYLMRDVTEVQVGAPMRMFTNIKDGTLIEVRCKSLWEGLTGHYALPVYCVAAQVKVVGTRA